MALKAWRRKHKVEHVFVDFDAEDQDYPELTAQQADGKDVHFTAIETQKDGTVLLVHYLTDAENR